MTVSELGFDNLLNRSLPNTTTELGEDSSSSYLPAISGSSVAGGATTSASKKMTIDYDNNKIVFSDGATDRVLLGNLGDTDKYGIRVADSKGNIRLEISDVLQQISMYDVDYNQILKLDITGLHGYNSAGVEKTTIGTDGTLTANDITITGGSLNIGSGAFTVSNTGAVTASNITITGGSLTIGANFSVTNTGILTAYNGVFTGAISASTINIGSNFSVDLLGNLICNNATVTGDLYTSSAGTYKIHANSGDYLDFYVSGAIKGRLRGTTARSGGLQLTTGDMAVTNDFAFIAQGTGSDFARFGVTSSNQTWLVTSADDALYIFDNDEKQIAIIGTTNVHLGGSDYAPAMQLHERAEPAGNPSANSIYIYVDSADGILKAKDDTGTKHNLW